MLVGIEDDRDLAAMRGFEQPRYLLQVLARCADVVLQPQIVALAAFWQEALFNDDVRDDPLAGRIALGRAIGVLDDVDTDRLDEAVDADLEDFVKASIGGQHQCDDGRPEQHPAVQCFRVEAHPGCRRVCVT
jgi:hypothetical protein